MINQIDIEGIKRAIEIIQMNPEVKRIDGRDWTVYLVGNILRIDIKQ